MNPEDKLLMIEEIAVLDKKEQADWVAGVEAGTDPEAVYQAVRQTHRAEFLQIIRKYNEAPAFRIPFPNPHNGKVESNP